MAFIKYSPYGKRKPHDLVTTTDRELQLWQELTMLRHCTTNGIYGKAVTAPYIDQAKIYYHDARASNWKSAGLLYYYSFLNLAKAIIVSKRGLSGAYMKSTSIYHGLSSEPQNISEIVDFSINIHPPESNNKKNIFSLFYKKITNQEWPFNSTVSLIIRDVVGYCIDISHELANFYGTSGKCVTLQSLIREVGNSIWFEVPVPNHYLTVINDFLGETAIDSKTFEQLDYTDKHDWLIAHERTAASLRNHTIIRMGREEINQIEDHNTKKYFN